MTILERVQNGATFLDANVVGWERKINLELLELASCRTCLLGQLYGGYEAGAKNHPDLGGPFSEAITRYGFLPTKEERNSDDEGAEAYAALTAAWRSLLLERAGQQVQQLEAV